MSTILVLRDELNIHNPMDVRFTQQEFSAVSIGLVSIRERCNRCPKMKTQPYNFNYEGFGVYMCFYMFVCFVFYSTEITAGNLTSKISKGILISKSVLEMPACL